MSESSDPAEGKHYVKKGNKKEVEIPRLERGLSEPKSLVLPHDRYYKYMSDNLAGGFSIVRRCNLLITILLWLYLVTETPARWCIFS